VPATCATHGTADTALDASERVDEEQEMPASLAHLLHINDQHGLADELAGILSAVNRHEARFTHVTDTMTVASDGNPAIPRKVTVEIEWGRWASKDCRHPPVNRTVEAMATALWTGDPDAGTAILPDGSVVELTVSAGLEEPAGGGAKVAEVLTWDSLDPDTYRSLDGRYRVLRCIPREPEAWRAFDCLSPIADYPNADGARRACEARAARPPAKAAQGGAG
jgi:hypothetical protein